MGPLLLIPLHFALVAGAHSDDRHDHHDHHQVIDRASQLVPWCRAEAEERFVAKGLTPYQWSASYHDRGKMLHVSGRLRVEGRDVEVRCRIARGSNDHYATIEIDDDRL